MGDNVTVRPATAADEGPLGELDRAAWSPLHAVMPRPQSPYPSFFGRSDPADILVAEQHGRILGYLRVAVPTPVPSNAHVRQIQGLVVAEDARRRGLGRALVRAAVDATRRQGATRITLRVLGHNHPARSLYAAEGFVVEGVLPGEFILDGEAVDDVWMGRSL